MPDYTDLRPTRQTKNITLTEVAEALDVWPARVGELELGRRRTTWPTATASGSTRLDNALGASDPTPWLVSQGVELCASGWPTHMRVLLVTNQGGHLTQLVSLRPWWETHTRHWVASPTLDARSKLADEEVTWAYHPTTRSARNLGRNALLASRVLRDFRPDVVISTGAGVAVPFFWLAHRVKAKTVFIEVVDRIDSKTLSGRLCHPVTDLFLTQWEEQQELWPGSELVGRLI